MELILKEPQDTYSKTQLEIMFAAEIIMGQKGIENTSHRDIINLAGQRNTSAISYHFGGIEGIVTALLDIRMAVLNAERLRLLNLLLKKENYNDMDLITVYIDPLYKKVFGVDKGWSNYIYFLHNLITSSRESLMSFIENKKYSGAAVSIERLFAERNGFSYDEMYRTRIVSNSSFFISSMTFRKRDLEAMKNTKKDSLIPSNDDFLKFIKETALFILTKKDYT